jgi:GTPase SAR1 family protein
VRQADGRQESGNLDPQRRVAILGAGGTGKTTLVTELANALARQNREPSNQALANAPAWQVTELSSDGLDASPRPHLILLMGLDLTSTNCHRAEQDASIRSALALAGINYHVIYGTGASRLAQALVALSVASTVPIERSTWVWQCDNCSDPACEHKLLTGLLSRRAVD